MAKPFPFRNLHAFKRVSFASLLCLILAAGVAEPSFDYSSLKAYRSQLNYVSVHGGKMAYLDVGKGEPVLLVHGVPTSSWLYRHVADRLVKKGFRVIAPDLLGYGNSEKPKDVELYDMKMQGMRLLTLMDSLNIASWTHVCHDAGGLWTWELLHAQPNRVKKLVILNTIGYKEGFKPPVHFKRDKPPGKVSFGLFGAPYLGKQMMNITLHNGMEHCGLSKGEKKGYWLPMREGGNRAVYNFFTDFEKTDSLIANNSSMFKSMNVPAMIIWGKHDDILIGETQIPMFQRDLRIKEEDVHVLADAKHFIQEEKPEEVANFIAAFATRK